MNFIIYEDDKDFIDVYKRVIFKVMDYSKMNYNLIEINSYDDSVMSKIEKLDGLKIYILDVEVPKKNGIDFAREIRNSGDWISPIIMVTSHEEFKIVGYTAKILMLDFILKKGNYEKELCSTLNLALEINSKKKSFCFSTRDELYQVPYEDILYIEKNLNDNTSNIYTKNNIYKIRKSIVNIEKDLIKEDCFFKTHRSCIVNLKNIKNVDFDKNIILFESRKIDLLSRANKKELKNRMGVGKDVKSNINVY